MEQEKPKTLIFQVAVCEVKPFYEFCINSAKEYARKIGAEHFVLREPRLKIKPVNSCRSKNALRHQMLPIFEKEVAFSNEFLDNYDAIAIIDCDMYIKDSAPNIFNELDNDTIFAGVIEKDLPSTKQHQEKCRKFSMAQYEPVKHVMTKWHPKNGVPFYNMGMMLFSNKIKKYLNGETPEQFIKRKEFEPFVNGEGHFKWSTDQSLLNFWIVKTGMKTKNLDWKWNALYKAIPDNKLKQAHFIHFFLSSKLPRRGEEIPRIIRTLT